MPNRASSYSLANGSLASAMAGLVLALPACTADRTAPDHAEAGTAGTNGATGGASNGAGGSDAVASGGTGGTSTSARTGGRSSAGGGTMDGRAGSGGQRQAASDAGAASDAASPSDMTLAGRHPGDKGIATDPDVVWAESFEEGTTAEFFARYSDSKQQGFAFDSDVPLKSSGKA